jgi:galactonate dehydratase
MTDEAGLSRREALGVAAAVGLIGAADAAQDVADRTTKIKISALKATPVGPKAYVRIDTNFGVSGWGEVTGSEPKVSCALAESLFQLLDGENPTRVEHLWQKVYRSHRDIRGGPVITHVLSALDMALWDIAGKLWGVPVYRLLGGPVRDKVRMYPSPKATKLGTGGPHPFSGNPSDIEGLVRSVRQTRERNGPDYTIMFDAHCAVPPPMLIQLCSAIAPYDVLWIEEPAVPGNIETFKRLKQQIRIPIATGERDRTIWDVIGYLQNGCIDILQPDVGQTGGISQMRKIAALCEAYHVRSLSICTMLRTMRVSPPHLTPCPRLRWRSTRPRRCRPSRPTQGPPSRSPTSATPPPSRARGTASAGRAPWRKPG